MAGGVRLPAVREECAPVHDGESSHARAGQGRAGGVARVDEHHAVAVADLARDRRQDEIVYDAAQARARDAPEGEEAEEAGECGAEERREEEPLLWVM
jgi:hypothetical protein